MGMYPDDANVLTWLERIGRKCYKSETCITPDSARGFVRSILKLDRMEQLRQRFSIILDTFDVDNEQKVDSLLAAVESMLEDPPHESVIEHTMMTVCFVFDRGVSHEMVRHRLAAFTQESTRYCNYSKGKFGNEIAVIEPSFWAPPPSELQEPRPEWKGHEKYEIWRSAMKFAESVYMDLVAAGAKPQEARSVLPNSLKTEIVVSANFREWRHIFKMRTSTKAHPQMREVMVPLLRDIQALPNLGLLFEDIHVREVSP
jgi:thymidylate synthase (FAD)